MKWSDLNKERQTLLAAWYILADASPPEHGEELPLEAVEAISYLAAATGKRKRYRYEKQVRGGTLAGSHFTPNGKRIIRRRVGIGMLAS